MQNSSIFLINSLRTKCFDLAQFNFGNVYGHRKKYASSL